MLANRHQYQITKNSFSIDFDEGYQFSSIAITRQGLSFVLNGLHDISPRTTIQNHYAHSPSVEAGAAYFGVFLKQFEIDSHSQE
jgi:hypothetical protein